MRTILAIDPGPKESAYMIWNPECENPVHAFGHIENDAMLDLILQRGDDELAIEMVASYGMAVGADVFETVFWIGRFWQRSPSDHKTKVYRKDVKMHLCHSMRAKDANIRQALIDKHGAVGTKKNPGKLYGVSKHVWAALAVADYAATQQRHED